MTNDIRKYINIVEYAQQESSWDSIFHWDGMPDKHKNKLMNAFSNPTEMIDLVSGGRADAMACGYYSAVGKLVFRLMEKRNPLEDLLLWYNFENGVVEYDSIRSNDVNKTMIIARKILRGLIEFCKRMDATRIFTNPEEDGSYMWARLGFYPVDHEEQWESQIAGIEQNLQILINNGNPDPEQIEKYKNIINNTNHAPQAIWLLSVEPHARELLYDILWHGLLDLNNSVCLKRLKRFVRI